MMQRAYDAIITSLSVPPGATREQRMQILVDLAWEHLSPQDVSWIGFYLDRPGEPDESRLVLGPSRNSPACSPIGLHGVCGQALLQKETRIVPDVAELGPDYIACDPRDRAEIVVPLIDPSGTCWAVLDLDSHSAGAFSERDDEGLRGVLKKAGLIDRDLEEPRESDEVTK